MFPFSTSRSLFSSSFRLARKMNKIENVEISELTNPRFIKPKEVKFTQNGQQRRWEMVSFSDCVFCLIFNKETQAFVLVRQFRLPVYAHKAAKDVPVTGDDGMTLEVCAGIVDKTGKSFKEHVVAEVEEETGYKVTEDRLELVKCYVGAVGIAGVHSRVYYVEVTNADKAHTGGGVAAEGEMIEVVELPFEEAKEMVTCEPDESVVSQFDATFLYLIYWFLYTKESHVIVKSRRREAP